MVVARALVFMLIWNLFAWANYLRVATQEGVLIEHGVGKSINTGKP
jgi:hypothetical protein